MKTHASRLVAKVLKRTVKFKKSKLISVKRTVVVCTIVAATPTVPVRQKLDGHSTCPLDFNKLDIIDFTCT